MVSVEESCRRVEEFTSVLERKLELGGSWGLYSMLYVVCCIDYDYMIMLIITDYYSNFDPRYKMTCFHQPSCLLVFGILNSADVDRIMFFDPTSRKQVFSAPFSIRVCHKNVYVYCL
jgi:hypothetical protein